MNEDCICCLSALADTTEIAAMTALACVVAAGIEQVTADLCEHHRELVVLSAQHASKTTSN